MIKFLRLIRWPNLLIVVFTQYVMRYFVLKPLLENYYVINQGELVHLHELGLQMSNKLFALLVFATVCITAAGYVINDYFDTKADRLNRPKRVIVGKFLSRRWAITTHIILNTLGILSGVYVSFKIGLLSLGLIFILVSGLLWFYSTNYKRQFLIGNLIVAMLTAIVPIMVVIYEVPLLIREYADLMRFYHANFNFLFGWVGGFSIFAFVLTLLREIIKDMEDFEGDEAVGVNSLPIVLGANTTKTVTVFLSLVLLVLIWLAYMFFLRDIITLVYVIVLFTLPLLFITQRILSAKSQKDYHFISTMVKLVMLGGLLYTALIEQIIEKIIYT